MLLAVSMLIARSLGPQIAGPDALHPLQIAWARFTFGAMTVLPFALLYRVSLANTAWQFHVGRVITGFGGVVGIFAAAGLMSLTEATAISFLSPLFAMVFAILFLGERVGVWRWGAAALAFAGAMVLTRPGMDAFQPAALIAMAAAAMMGAELTFIKFLSGRETAVKILAINNVMAALLAGSIVAFVWTVPTIDQWGLLVALGLVMVTAQSFFLKGIAMAESNVAAPFFYTTLIFAAIYGWLVFEETPDTPTLIGAAFIVAGALLLTWRENLARRS